MQGERRQPEYVPKSDQCAPISYEYAKRFLMTKGLGNYADDMFQQMVLRLDRAKRRGTRVDKRYAFRTLRNLARSKLRKLGRQREIEAILRASPEAQKRQRDDPQEMASQKEILEMVERVLEGLDVRERVIFKLRACDSHHIYTFGKIAGIVGFSESLVRTKYNMVLRIIEGRLR